MHVDIISGAKDWVAIRGNWDKVFAADPDANLFLSWDWIDKRLKTGWGEWFILCVKESEQHSEYIAFFPLKMQTKMGPDAQFWQELVVAGIPLSDYTGFLCDPRFDGRAIPAMAKAILQRRWGYLVLHCFHASRKRTRLFVGCFPNTQFVVVDHEKKVSEDGFNSWICPYIDLPETWDDYLQTLSANTRQKLRRHLRKVEQSDEYRITHATPDTIDRDIDILVNLWGARWAEEKGVYTASNQEGLLEVYQGMAEDGLLIVSILWHGDKPVGGLALFTDETTKSILFFASGRDTEFKDVPPGMVLHAHSIRYAIENGYKTYDFLRGNEPYKLSFASKHRVIRTIDIYTKDKTNLGGAIDPLAIPTVFHQVQQSLRAGKAAEAVLGCRQILQADPKHTGARALFQRLTSNPNEPRSSSRRPPVPPIMAARPRKS